MAHLCDAWANDSLMAAEDDKAQAEWTVAEVARLSAQGHFLKDMAVLQRNIK